MCHCDGKCGSEREDICELDRPTTHTETDTPRKRYTGKNSANHLASVVYAHEGHSGRSLSTANSTLHVQSAAEFHGWEFRYKHIWVALG